jgi:glycosyltransferase involved in cell wall biosynthesis
MPGLLKRMDGWSMAVCVHPLLKRLLKETPDSVLDAHFAYPDGFAASVLARWHGLPMSLTLRGSKDTALLGTTKEPLLRKALREAQCVFAVSDALKETFESRFDFLRGSIEVIRNGVDADRFHPVSRIQARQRLNIAADATVVISVGWLVEGKGHQRIIPIISRLRARYPRLVYLVVGGNAGGIDGHAELEALARAHDVADIVRLCGPQAPDELKWYYGAADVFALATRTEGWANVLLESMACGVPVVTTRVGGNPQVVCDESLGILTEFWDEAAFENALDVALHERHWDTEALVAYARRCGWDTPVSRLVARLSNLRRSVDSPANQPSDCTQR